MEHAAVRTGRECGECFDVVEKIVGREVSCVVAMPWRMPLRQVKEVPESNKGWRVS